MSAYNCEICGKCVEYQGAVPKLYPFCCERCKLVDLGRWFNEQYYIDADVAPDDLEQPDISGSRARREAED